MCVSLSNKCMNVCGTVIVIAIITIVLFTFVIVRIIIAVSILTSAGGFLCFFSVCFILYFWFERYSWKFHINEKAVAHLQNFAFVGTVQTIKNENRNQILAAIQIGIIDWMRKWGGCWVECGMVCNWDIILVFNQWGMDWNCAELGWDFAWMTLCVGWHF